MSLGGEGGRTAPLGLWVGGCGSGAVPDSSPDPIHCPDCSTENGEKGDGGAEGGPEVETPEKQQKAPPPRERKEPPPPEGAFEFWTELEVQRVKFLVRIYGGRWGGSWGGFGGIHGVTLSVFPPPQNYLSRNFYNLRFLALFLAFAINFILLFYKV